MKIDKDEDCTACSGSGYYCGRACGSCGGTGKEYSPSDIIESLESEIERLKAENEAVKLKLETIYEVITTKETKGLISLEYLFDNCGFTKENN